MIAISRVAARPIARAGRNIATALGLVGLLAALTACAGGNATSSLAPAPTAPASAPPASPPPATASAPAAPAEPAPAKHLTATEINEKCWMGTEKYHADNIDRRMKLVDKCVADMKRAQGG